MRCFWCLEELTALTHTPLWLHDTSPTLATASMSLLYAQTSPTSPTFVIHVPVCPYEVNLMTPMGDSEYAWLFR